MEDGILSPGTMLAGQSDSAMDFDFMDQLLLDGCWLETTVGSEFLNLSPSNSYALVDSSLLWPVSDNNDGEVITRPSNKDTQEVEVGSLYSPGNLFSKELPVRSPGNSLLPGQHLAGCDAGEGSEVNRKWWIGPRDIPGSGSSVMERLMKALWHIKLSVKQKDVLIQVWVPENRGGRRVLRTHEDLFALDPSCWKLANYREVSANYQFSAEEDSKDFAGLPGRVFLGKVPEWTPDVRFFRSNEYQRVDHAQRLDVSGTLALPVFERGSKTCLGVIEVVTTERKIKYRPELENVCKALEAVDLQSSEFLGMENVKAGNVSYQAVLPEIQELLRSACETHKLPLVQTWVPCIQQGKGGCRHSDDNYMHCVSTVDHACYVTDPAIWPFHEVCSEHHLLKGQGVVGGAFLTNQPCFSSDITSYTKTEYPLAHHAKVFKLCAAVAIRLRSFHTSKVDFVLEFFLPVDCRDPEEQKKMLTSLSIVIQEVCHTLRVVTDEELAEESGFASNKMDYSEKNLMGNSCRTGELTEVQQMENIFTLGAAAEPELCSDIKSIHCRIDEKENPLEGGHSGNSGSITCDCPTACEDKRVEKRRPKAEKTISLEVLQQYFAGSLKNAAKSIGVCPTTLKRICRRHGIQRWPSRKIKKVGHSLQKIQHVIDSVHGASGIGSFYKNFPELASSCISRTSPLSTSKQADLPKPSTEKGGTFSSQVTPPKSPSSCGQSSSSSHSCSSGTLQHHSTFIYSANVNSTQKEFSGSGVVKRVRSNSELHSLSEERKKLMPRSESHKSLIKQSFSENLVPLPEIGSHISQEIDFHRVKVTYGSEKIRLRMPKSWRFRDLLQDVTRRFSISDISRVHMKYLDDEMEWVLLTCDDDLQECIDLCQSSKGQTLRLMLLVSTNSLKKSSGSRSPSRS